MKCILSRSKWFTPVEFEPLGGKDKSKNWRRSIYHGNSQLGNYLSSQADNARGLSPIHSSSRSQSPAPVHDRSLIPPVSSVLINPILAFIKAYRLRGDISGLRNALLSVVDSLLLVDAHKSLWQHCKNDLEELGLSFKNRRDSDKRSVSDVKPHTSSSQFWKCFLKAFLQLDQERQEELREYLWLLQIQQEACWHYQEHQKQQ